MRCLAAWGARLALAVSLLISPTARAEEGMWTFDAFPAASVQRVLGVRLDGDWLRRVRAGSVRLTTGCSGALVSPNGLVVTNQHCILACAQSLSDPAHDHVRDGYGIGGADPPRACPGLQAEILVEIVDVTAAVFEASAGRSGDAFIQAREDVLARSEQRVCGGDRRFRCQVISFFGGGQFKVYRYRRYDDVRLVFAPELAVAFFGGDPENFTFPRYDLDVAVLRLYERGAPAVVRHWLVWSTRTPTPGEAVFVSGSPGSTQRALTVAQLETLRDVANPDLLAMNALLRDRLKAYATQGPDQRRLVADRLFNAENALKMIEGQDAALADPGFMAARRDEEARLKAALASDSRLASQVGDPWADLAVLQTAYARQYPLWRQLENGAGAGSHLFWYARTLVRGAAERARPSPERLPEFSDARLPLLQKALLDPQPIDEGLERLFLEAWFDRTRVTLGPADPAEVDVLGSGSPAALASRLVAGSTLADPARRAALWRGGQTAIQASTDPLIVYARRIDALSRAAREVWEERVLGPTEDAAERIATVRFAVHGASVYPEATFSPRISFGRVEGWRDRGGPVEPFTTLGGLYSHATLADPRRLPPRWLGARAGLDTAAVLNFVTSNDIVGGNSGSPVVDGQGRMIGAAFDGNQASIAGEFAYDRAANRTVVVTTGAVSEALSKVYGRDDLAGELQGAR